MNNCIGRSRSWRRRSSAGIIPLCKDEMECCLPIASQIQQQKEHQMHWHRRFSPVKRLPQLVRTNSFVSNGKRDEGSSKAKEKSSQKQKMRQKETQKEGKKEEEEEDKAMDGRKRKERKSFNSIRFSSPSSRKDCRQMNNSFSIAPMTSLSSAIGVSDDCTLSPQQEMSSPEGMSCSFLISPAWYRDSDGRTGFRHELEIPMSGRLQKSAIKEKGTTNIKRNCNNEIEVTKVHNKRRSFVPCHLPISSVQQQQKRTNWEGKAKERQQKEKMVKFAETIKINEIAPRENGPIERTFSNDNSPIASSCCAFVESGPIWASEKEQSQHMGKDKRRRPAEVIRMEKAEREKELSRETHCQRDSAYIELLIEQFFNHCQHISKIGDSQQISVYDNVNSIPNDEKTKTDSEQWLHTKTKVLVQRELRRDRSEKNGIERDVPANKRDLQCHSSEPPLSRVPLTKHFNRSIPKMNNERTTHS